MAEQKKFNIVVDVIIAGGKKGTRLMVQQGPECFQNSVVDVTMGKWMGCGLVLANKQELTRLKARARADDIPARGASVGAPCSQIIHFWKFVCDKCSEAGKRRLQVLNKLKLDETLVWGKGVMIYTPTKRKDSAGGLKNRLLPMLAGAGIDNIPKQNRLEEWSKKEICDIIMKGSRAWVAAQPVVYSILTDHTYRHLCTVLASGRPGPKDLHIPWANFFPQNTCAAIQNACFQSAVAH